MERLMNKLIEMGRKPFGLGPFYIYANDKKEEIIEEIRVRGNSIEYDYEWYSLNDLCSIDSGLRQFLAENKMLFNYNDTPEFRIMKSAIQEDKEKFLLDHIVLRDN